MVILVLGGLKAQNFCGEHKYDGVHPNEVTGYLLSGTNVVSGNFVGFSAEYKRHLTNHWNVAGGVMNSYGKQMYGAKAQGGYRFGWGFSDFYFDGKVMFNRYHRWETNEFSANLSATWETPYFDLKIGESYIHYQMHSDGYTEPLTFTFGVGVNILPRWHSWTLGLFFRNYDEYYFENWNINWGLRFNAKLSRKKPIRLFGEFNVRPAGSISQLASKYETSGKLGIKYIW